MFTNDPTNLIPKPLLWLCAIPFIILLLPIGILYFVVCLIHALRHKVPFKKYSHDILFSIARPGFYVGLFVSVLIYGIFNISKRRAYKAQENKNKMEIKEKKSMCLEWLGQFPFLEVSQYKLSVYTSKDQAVGRLDIRVLNDEDKNTLMEKRSKLPERIHLEVFVVQKETV